jgi:hypothetical protein
VGVEDLDKLTMANVPHFSENHRGGKPQSNRKAIIELVGKIVSVELLGAVGFVGRFVLEMVWDRPE